jgi:hypothetical protein
VLAHGLLIKAIAMIVLGLLVGLLIARRRTRAWRATASALN